MVGEITSLNDRVNYLYDGLTLQHILEWTLSIKSPYINIMIF